MDFERYILEILLREIHFEQISLYTACGDNDYKGVDKTTFLQAARRHLPDCTEDENEQLYEWARERTDTAAGFFDFIAKVAGEFLEIKGGDRSGIYYREKNWSEKSQFFHWKELVTGLGQEIFMMALLARQCVINQKGTVKDAAKGINEKERKPELSGEQLCDMLCASFPRIDDEALNKLLNPKQCEQGPAENHFHLKGSFPVFLLNWTCMMNHVGDGNDFFHRMKKEYRQEEWMAGENDAQNHGKEKWTSGQLGNRQFRQKRKGLLEMAVAAAGYRLHLYEVYNDIPVDVRMPFDYETDLDEVDLGMLRSRIEYYRDSTEQKWDEKPEQVEKGYGWVNNPDYILAGRWETIDGRKGDSASVERQTKKAGRQGEGPEAVEETLWDKLYGRDEVSIAGERYFLYRCFCEIFKAHSLFKTEDRNLFYKYLLISLRIRAELVQMNRNRGFGNFAAYQERKEDVIDYYPEYQSQVIRLTGCSLRKQQRLSGMEMRISPKDTAYETLNKIAEYQAEIERNAPVKKFGDCFYVLHFPKERESMKKEFLGLRARNDELRQKMARHIEEQKQLILQEWNGYLYHEMIPQVRGYDTCSGEIGCRPEVFAWFYRSIRAFTEGRQASIKAVRKTGRDIRTTGRDLGVGWIHWTYHVGEDFLDLVDGLRAIDETVQFCELPPGSRIGHGMALGLDAAHYYGLKGYYILLPRQDLLDNIAWTLGFCQEYGIVISRELQKTLEDKFIKLHRDIYGEILTGDGTGNKGTVKDGTENGTGNRKMNQGGAGDEEGNEGMDQDQTGKYGADITERKSATKKEIEYILDSENLAKKEAAATSMDNWETDGGRNGSKEADDVSGGQDGADWQLYYRAWKLRGDRPELYLDYEKPVYGPVFEEALREGLDEIRADKRCRDYYRKYHFSQNVREQGEKRELFHVSQTYIELIGRIQVELRYLLTEKQIRVECNPTSNYKIGPFNRFDEHPMLRMYGKNLEEGAASRMCISINTDDMGVFQTSLETEYASMYVALLKSRDVHGRPRYTKEAVLRWLEDVKRFGQQQAFRWNKEALSD